MVFDSLQLVWERTDGIFIRVIHGKLDFFSALTWIVSDVKPRESVLCLDVNTTFARYVRQFFLV